MNNSNSGETKVKLNLQQVYDHILADCTEEIISELATTPTTDPFRFEADFGYAVRALALFQMKRYDEALVYARKALEINSNIADRSKILDEKTWSATWTDSNNYFFVLANYILNMSELCYRTFSPEFMALYEPGDYVRYYSDEKDWNAYEEHQKGAPGSYIYAGSSARINTYGVTSEMMHYLAGECLIRQGKIDEGLDMVDKVRTYRIHPSKFAPFKGTTSNQGEAIAMLRKAKTVECIGNYMNFFDNKRFNSEPEYAADINHNCGDLGTFTVKAGSPLWIYPFPMNATSYNSTLTQNIK
ncbi:MAG: tetratricopeptide repeat protein [Muribaculaceae bacterium]|nr:tetratricopeptide repeat protein [Muribaculaceae bacterium]